MLSEVTKTNEIILREQNKRDLIFRHVCRGYEKRKKHEVLAGELHFLFHKL